MDCILQWNHHAGNGTIGQALGLGACGTRGLDIGRSASRVSDYRTIKQLLTPQTIFELLGEELAIQCADNYHSLRKHGISIRKTVDVIIATFV